LVALRFMPNVCHIRSGDATFLFLPRQLAQPAFNGGGYWTRNRRAPVDVSPDLRPIYAEIFGEIGNPPSLAEQFDGGAFQLITRHRSISEM
jgi:hypothetical protein